MLEDDLLRDIRSKRKKIHSNLIEWGIEHYRFFPWHENRTPYSVLISEVLLKRTTASAVRNLFSDFMSMYPNINVLAKADCKVLEKTLSKLGYHKVRAKILVELANFIVYKHKGDVPKQKEELLEIPHVGNYTANAILSFSFGKKAAIVDTNVERILKRVFVKHAPKGTSLKPFQEMADRLVPKLEHECHNYALLDLGGTVCISGLPRCGLCPIREVCDYFLLGNPHSPFVGQKHMPTCS